MSNLRWRNLANTNLTSGGMGHAPPNVISYEQLTIIARAFWPRMQYLNLVMRRHWTDSGSKTIYRRKGLDAFKKGLERQGKMKEMFWSRGNWIDMTTVCNMYPWLGSCFRTEKQTLVWTAGEIWMGFVDWIVKVHQLFPDLEGWTVMMWESFLVFGEIHTTMLRVMRHQVCRPALKC